MLSFVSIIYSIFANVYLLICSLTRVILPPSAIASVWGPYGVKPAKEQKADAFLSYTKRRVGLLEPQGRNITLMMDDIHIQQYIQ